MLNSGICYRHPFTTCTLCITLHIMLGFIRMTRGSQISWICVSGPWEKWCCERVSAQRGEARARSTPTSLRTRCGWLTTGTTVTWSATTWETITTTTCTGAVGRWGRRSPRPSWGRCWVNSCQRRSQACQGIVPGSTPLPGEEMLDPVWKINIWRPWHKHQWMFTRVGKVLKRRKPALLDTGAPRQGYCWTRYVLDLDRNTNVYKNNIRYYRDVERNMCWVCFADTVTAKTLTFGNEMNTGEHKKAPRCASWKANNLTS